MAGIVHPSEKPRERGQNMDTVGRWWLGDTYETLRSWEVTGYSIWWYEKEPEFKREIWDCHMHGPEHLGTRDTLRDDVRQEREGSPGEESEWWRVEAVSPGGWHTFSELRWCPPPHSVCPFYHTGFIIFSIHSYCVQIIEIKLWCHLSPQYRSYIRASAFSLVSSGSGQKSDTMQYNTDHIHIFPIHLP